MNFAKLNNFVYDLTLNNSQTVMLFMHLNLYLFKNSFLSSVKYSHSNRRCTSSQIVFLLQSMQFWSISGSNTALETSSLLFLHLNLAIFKARFVGRVFKYLSCSRVFLNILYTVHDSDW